MSCSSKARLLSVLVFAVWIGAAVAAPGVGTSSGQSKRGPAILKYDTLRNYVKTFNSKDHTHFGQVVSNQDAADWMADNVPLFECPDN